MQSNEVIETAHEDPKQRVLRLNVALVGQNQGKYLTRSLVNDSVNGVEAVPQLLGHDAVKCLR